MLLVEKTSQSHCECEKVPYLLASLPFGSTNNIDLTMGNIMFNWTKESEICIFSYIFHERWLSLYDLEMFVRMEFFSGLWATPWAHNFVRSNMLRIICHIHCCVTSSCAIKIRNPTICWWLISCCYGFKMCILICTTGHYPILCDLRKPLNHTSTLNYMSVRSIQVTSSVFSTLVVLPWGWQGKSYQCSTLDVSVWVHDLLCVPCILLGVKDKSRRRE